MRAEKDREKERAKAGGNRRLLWLLGLVLSLLIQKAMTDQSVSRSVESGSPTYITRLVLVIAWFGG